MTIEVLKNSFVSLEEANTYFDERFGSSVWEQATQEDKEKALITATKRLNIFSYIGYKKDMNQPLEFPRKLTQDNYCVFKMPDVPQEIIYATCEEAIALLEFSESIHIKNKQLGIQNMNIGVGTVSYSNDNNKLLSMSALSFAEKYFKKGAYFV